MGEGAELARRLLLAAVDAVDASRVAEGAIGGLLQRGWRLGGCTVLAWGKAAVPMARAAARRCSPRIGVVVAPRSADVHGLAPLEVRRGGHPVPADDAPETGRRVLELARSLGPDDVLLCLVSGGGSAMLELPEEGISLADIRRRTEALLRSGADIHALNAERTRMSRLKGGKLARAAAPARVVNVILSDVPGGDPSVVASGPTVPPQGSEEGFGHVTTVVAADNGTAQDAVVRAGGGRGLILVRRDGFVSGEAREAGARFCREAWQRCKAEGVHGVVWGGETTVHVTGDGRGGRNQELVLGAAEELADGALGSLGTDGVDGASDAAGAVLDGAILERARGLGLAPADFLARNDSEAFFRRAGGVIETGPTGTNVADVCVYLAPAALTEPLG